MRWCDKNVGRLEHRALAATSQPERKKFYRDIAQNVANEVPVVYLFNAYYTYAYRPRLQNFTPNAFLPTWNAYSWELLR